MTHAEELARMAADKELSTPYREAAAWAVERLAILPAMRTKNAAPTLPAIDARPASAVRDEALEEAAQEAETEGWCQQQPMVGFSEREEGSRDCAERIAAAIRALKGGAK